MMTTNNNNNLSDPNWDPSTVPLSWRNVLGPGMTAMMTMTMIAVWMTTTMTTMAG